MSTLSKVFVVLVFIVALVKLGIDATLFAQRLDWKDKFGKEANYHFQTQQIKNAEIADMQASINSLVTYNNTLKQRVEQLDTERSSLSTTIANLTRQLDTANANHAKIAADMDVFVRQLEVQLTQVQEMATKVEDYRGKLASALSKMLTATQELQYNRQELEKTAKDLASLEDQHQNLARDKKRLEEVMAGLAARGVQLDQAPHSVIEAKVTAVSNDIGLVIISVGRDDKVLEGNEFTIYRGSNFIAKIVVDKVDRKWSAGRVLLKKEEPRISDDVSNNVLTSTFKSR